MEVDPDNDEESAAPDAGGIAQLTSKVVEQGKLIESLQGQIAAQNQRMAKNEHIMRAILQQMHQMHLTVTPITEIFRGMQFFITADGGGYPGGLPPGANLPYPKDEYLCAIVKCGGQVIDVVGREDSANAYLISDKPARTVKYIYCLAAGIPCLSYEWIRKCLAQKEVVDWKPFRLKSGYSMEREVVIESHTEKPIKDVKVFIATDSDELYAYWKPVLLAAQACLLSHCKSALVPPPGTELIITDGACRRELLDDAKESNIPTVRPEWLVQTIILGVRADVHRHDLYGVPDDAGIDGADNEIAEPAGAPE